MAKKITIDYKKFIENEFFIIDKDDRVVPFILNSVQSKYYDILKGRHKDLEGIREIVLKARQQGMSTFILAMFAVDFICRPYSKSVCISHNQDATEALFQKVKFYIQTFCERHNIPLKDYLKTDNRLEMVNKVNNAEFTIMTAGGKVGGRGSTVRNILFSETAFYPDVAKITAEEIIEGTSQMVGQGIGKIFIESTANGYGNYYQRAWARAEALYKEALATGDYSKVGFYPTFFGAKEFYTQEWLEKKRATFVNQMMFFQEYPSTPDEAFISSGSPFFDMETLKFYSDHITYDPIKVGQLATDGEFI